MQVTEEDFPNLYEALIELAYDNGLIHSQAVMEEVLFVPDDWAGEARLAEVVLASLPRGDIFPSWMGREVQHSSFMTFVSGEENDVQALCTTPARKRVNMFLNEWFDGSWS